jgi:Uma2 family endonuclease
MPSEIPRKFVEIDYYESAQEYLKSLPLEHFMETTNQATQLEITLASLALVKAQRKDIHVFNELLVQYPVQRGRYPRQVVPDNMVVVFDEPITADISYDIPLQPVKPFLVMGYVSKSNKRKDYVESLEKYEKGIKVPYYLVFYPDTQDLSLYRHNKKKYISVKPNKHERCAISELELEVAILDEWVRYWFRGELLPLPGDLLRELQNVQTELTQERQARLKAEEEIARLREEIER